MSEKTQEKFPSNKMEIQGVVKNVKLSEDKSRLNITVLTNEKTQKYINVLISGKEKMDAFSKINEQDKTIAISGIANFSEYNGNKNVTLIANKFESPENSKIANNKISIVANLGENPKILQNKGGEEFAVLSVAHNESIADVQKTSWIEIIVPSKKMEAFKELNPEKGNSVQITGNVQPKKFENKEGNTVYSFSVVANKIEQSIKVEKAQAAPEPKVEQTKEKSKGKNM